jgi:hypothetical protein
MWPDLAGLSPEKFTTRAKYAPRRQSLNKRRTRPMVSELKVNQHVKIVQQRGTLADGVVLEVFDNGDVLVYTEGAVLIVERENVQ